MNQIKFFIKIKEIKESWMSKIIDKSYPVINTYVQNRVQPCLEFLYNIARIVEVDVKDLLVSEQLITALKK